MFEGGHKKICLRKNIVLDKLNINYKKKDKKLKSEIIN